MSIDTLEAGRRTFRAATPCRTPAEHDDMAQRGAALLNERGPDRWYNRVNLATMVMINPRLCVLGQVYGDERPTGVTAYTYGQHVLGLLRAADARHTPAVVAYGFGGVEGQGDSWRKIITALRNNRVQLLLSLGWQLTRDALSVVSTTGECVDIAEIENVGSRPQVPVSV